MQPIYRFLRESLDAAIEQQSRAMGRDVRTVSERFEELFRDADALIERLGRAEQNGDLAQVGALNERYGRIVEMLKDEARRIDAS